MTDGRRGPLRGWSRRPWALHARIAPARDETSRAPPGERHGGLRQAPLEASRTLDDVPWWRVAVMSTTTCSNEDDPRSRRAPPQACLTVVHHPNHYLVGQWTTLESGTKLLLGRDCTCLGVGSLADRAVSRMHAVVEGLMNGTVELRDLGSRNGTFANGCRVQRAVLRDGDVIGIGGILLLFHVSPVTVRVARSRRLLGVGHGIGEVIRQIEQVAPHPVTVLVMGETGTGKELVAQELHDKSGRKGPLLSVNCGGMADSLMQAELFGALKGAYSGADRDRVGLFEAADGGSLLLDEIGDASEPLQRSLLRVLQDGRVQPLGGTRSRAVDTRVIAATHRDLAWMMEQGKFREDLYARLSGWIIRIPPFASVGKIFPTWCGASCRRQGIRTERSSRRSCCGCCDTISPATCGNSSKSWNGRASRLARTALWRSAAASKHSWANEKRRASADQSRCVERPCQNTRN